MNQEEVIELDRKYHQAQEIENSLGIIESEISELDRFAIALEEIENNKNKKILAGLGRGVFIKSELEEKDLFVDVGSGTFLKKSIKETVKTIKNQIGRLKKVRVEQAAKIDSISLEMQELVKQVENEQD